MAYKTGLIEDMKRHNKNVEDAFRRAEKGEIINLTDLMIGKEKLDVRIDALDALARKYKK